jgi:hypothetical protein
MQLRLYVLLVGWPVRVYIHQTGIAKFTTEDIEQSCSSEQECGATLCESNKAAHIIQLAEYRKEDPSIFDEKDREDFPTRWSLRVFKQYCEEHGIQFEELIRKIDDALVRTVLAGIEPAVSSRANSAGIELKDCFQLLGVDFDVDSNAQPFILDVNVNPTLGARAAFDIRDRTQMLREMFALLGFNAPANAVESKLEQANEILAKINENPSGDEKLHLAKLLYEQENKANWRMLYPTSGYEQLVADSPFHSLYELHAAFIRNA